MIISLSACTPGGQKDDSCQDVGIKVIRYDRLQYEATVMNSFSALQKMNMEYPRMTKLMIEDILRDICKADDKLNIAILRYFNPIGAHESGLIGEDPNDIPNNLMPYISQVAVGKLEELKIFGDDYNTSDGTGVRDYIHVVDLAKGHLMALNKLETSPGLVIYNLGTGNGYSVLEMVKAFSIASGKEVAYKIVDRRLGDVAICYADPTKATKELGWKAKFGIDKMCEDVWRWQSNNPNGYNDKL